MYMYIITSLRFFYGVFEDYYNRSANVEQNNVYSPVIEINRLRV